MSVTITHNPEYHISAPFLEQMRDTVRGSMIVKVKGQRYLPHPSNVDTESDEQKERYRKYLHGAEFSDFTGHTKRVMLGKLKLDDMEFMPPGGLEYLAEDTDKDGLSMRGLVESCCGNVLETKWHLLLADYKGLSELDTSEVEPSAQDVKDANPRATIKQYRRENVLDWDFARINGRMQLTYLLLLEVGSDVDHDTGSREDVKSYLKLGLDEKGYYQQKRTDSVLSYETYGDRVYLEVNGKPLDFIPASIVADEEIDTGHLPLELGFLSPIGDLALHRYNVSAKYKESLNAFIPSMHITGVDANVWETFKEVNQRNFVASGPGMANIWSGTSDNPVEVSLLEAAGSLQQFDNYFEKNKNEVRAIGGVFKADQTVQRTATEISAEIKTSTAVLVPIACSVESAIKWQIAYCALFEGLTTVENVHNYMHDIELCLNKDFEINKLTVEEVKGLLEIYNTGLLPKEEFLRLMEFGSWTISKAEDLLNQLDSGELNI